MIASSRHFQILQIYINDNLYKMYFGFIFVFMFLNFLLFISYVNIILNPPGVHWNNDMIYHTLSVCATMKAEEMSRPHVTNSYHHLPCSYILRGKLFSHENLSLCIYRTMNFHGTLTWGDFNGVIYTWIKIKDESWFYFIIYVYIIIKACLLFVL